MTNDINIRIVRALYFRGNTNWNYHRLLYPHNTLYIVLGGNGHIRYNGTVTDMLPGHAYLIPLRHQHDLWCDTHVEKVYADVHVELFPGYDVFADTNQIPSLSLGLEHCMRLRNLYDGGVREHLELRGELEIILARFMTDEPKSVSAKMISLLPVITEIQQNLSSQIRRQNLAEKFGWNPTVLSRTFK